MRILITFYLIGCILAKSYAQVDMESLFGPRIGATLITGEFAQKLDEKYNAKPIISQFGWQFEWRFFNTQKGVTGIVEVIPLIGGVEQNLFVPSISSLVGLRYKNGFEVGIGPNASLTGFGIVFAVGTTIKTGEINWPINLAFVPSTKGARFTLLFGFNIAKD
ncbi:MAG: hypothetical protein F9K37_12450 [Bacteroidales bacterium]|nr:MAG: hypothetical protein F9K37_12450 [Bacteroidales bacterium]